MCLFFSLCTRKTNHPTQREHNARGPTEERISFGFFLLSSVRGYARGIKIMWISCRLSGSSRAGTWASEVGIRLNYKRILQLLMFIVYDFATFRGHKTEVRCACENSLTSVWCIDDGLHALTSSNRLTIPPPMLCVRSRQIHRIRMLFFIRTLFSLWTGSRLPFIRAVTAHSHTMCGTHYGCMLIILNRFVMCWWSRVKVS